MLFKIKIMLQIKTNVKGVFGVQGIKCINIKSI